MSAIEPGGDPERRLTDIVVRDTDVSDAVDEPLRAMILDMLADEAMTAGTVHEELDHRGIERTENTVRHHINALRDAGLVEVVRYEEGRGGTKKYYGANTIVLSYSVPPGAEETVDEMVAAIQPEVAAIVEDLAETYGEELDAVTGEMAPCEHCRTQKYEIYLLLTVLRRAFVGAYQDYETTGD